MTGRGTEAVQGSAEDGSRKVDNGCDCVTSNWQQGIELKIQCDIRFKISSCIAILDTLNLI